MATLRYIVNDVDAAIDFYTNQLGFDLEEHMGAPFASVSYGDLTVWLAGPGSSARRPMPDGRLAEPGGWNRLVIEVTNIDDLVAKLQSMGVVFRNQPLRGPGGTQVVIEDPSGNAIELFQPA